MWSGCQTCLTTVLVQSSFHWHFPASVSEELPEKRKEFIPRKRRGCACFLPVTGNFKPDLSLVCSVWSDTNQRKNHGIFLPRPWWSHSCLNLRPISVQHNPCCFVTAYCMHILCASAALNCLVCTKAELFLLLSVVLSFAALGVSCSASTKQAAFRGTRDLYWWWRGQKNYEVQPVKTWFFEMGLKIISETNSSGVNALLKCVFYEGCGSEVCYSVSAFSAFSQFLLHFGGLSVSCYPWCPADTVSMSLVCHGEALSSSGCSSEGWACLPGYAAPEQLYTNFLYTSSLLNFPCFIFSFLGTFLGWVGCVCVLRGWFLPALH